MACRKNIIMYSQVIMFAMHGRYGYIRSKSKPRFGIPSKLSQHAWLATDGNHIDALDVAMIIMLAACGLYLVVLSCSCILLIVGKVHTI